MSECIMRCDLCGCLLGEYSGKYLWGKMIKFVQVTKWGHVDHVQLERTNAAPRQNYYIHVTLYNIHKIDIILCNQKRRIRNFRHFNSLQ